MSAAISGSSTITPATVPPGSTAVPLSEEAALRPQHPVNTVSSERCYDSRTDGRARFAPHSAFTDPTTPADAAPRESIEIRTLVFHSS